jgi:hypothetical protein
VAVAGIEEHEILMDRQVPHLRQRVAALATIFPEELPGAAVERLHHVPRIGDEQNAVVDQRRGLRCAGLHCPRPLEPQVPDVLCRDLRERTEALSVERPPPAQPRRRIWIGEHRIGHWRHPNRRRGWRHRTDGGRARRRTGCVRLWPQAPQEADHRRNIFVADRGG